MLTCGDARRAEPPNSDGIQPMSRRSVVTRPSTARSAAYAEKHEQSCPSRQQVVAVAEIVEEPGTHHGVGRRPG